VVRSIQAQGGRGLALRADSADAEAVKGAVWGLIPSLGSYLTESIFSDLPV
jgi:hypothetical protein